MSLIHTSAVIEDGAVLGENVSVGPFAYIGPNVKIGDNTTVASHAVIEGHTTIGKNNRIFPHAAIGTIPQDLKFGGVFITRLHPNDRRIIAKNIISSIKKTLGPKFLNVFIRRKNEDPRNFFSSFCNINHDQLRHPS